MLKRIAMAASATLAALFPAARALAAPGDPPAYAVVFDKAFAPDFTATTRIDLKGETIVATVPVKVIEVGLL